MLRVLAIEGHSGLLGPFEYWRNGHDVPSTTGVAFSHQLFDALRAHGATATVLAQRPEIGRASAHGITVEHTGSVLFGRSGLDYHRETLRLTASLLARAQREKIDVLMTVGYPPAGLLLPLLYAGRSIVVTHHCVLWPKFGAPSLAQRALWSLDKRAYQHPRCHVLAVSDDVANQVEQIREGKGPPIVRFFPLFRREVFDRIAPIDTNAPCLRVGFIGRIERNKGVFDVVDAVRRLRAEGYPIALDICGDGSARVELTALIQHSHLADTVTYHGWCNQDQLRTVIGGLHVVAAPTRSDFVEGFNMVVVEALLAHRPVITSRTCPALDYVRGPGTVEIAVESTAELTEALRRFVSDREALASASSQCAAHASFFYDERYAYRTAVNEVLSAIRERRTTHPVAPSAAELRIRQELAPNGANAPLGA